MKNQSQELSGKIKGIETDIANVVQRLRKYAYEWRNAAQRCLKQEGLSDSETARLFAE